MTASNTSIKVDVIGQDSPCRADETRRRPVARITGILVLITLLAGSLYLSATVSASRKPSNNPKKNVPKEVAVVRDILSSPAIVKSIAPMLSPQSSSPTVTTFAGDCTTGNTLFNVQDADKTVCAKVENATPGWFVIWSNSNFRAVQSTALTSGNQNVTFTLNANSSLGDWRVILYEPFGAGVYAVTPFTVIDAENPLADTQVDTAAKTPKAAAGAQAVFAIQVANAGPNSASSVQVTDAIPTNATFVSFVQLSGPLFTCTNPQEGDASGTTTCSIASLAKGDTASFLGTYLVNTGVSAGTEITNTANIASTTPDRVVPDVDNNTSSASVQVASSPCVITPSVNITTDADSGQAGAVVTYATPEFTGDCGAPAEGQTSPISCNPASGSFFSVGTTTVICGAQAGTTATFQVTVNNPGALTISLNGPNSITIECGQAFTDPGATAIDGAGQPVEVAVAYNPVFDTEAPASGTYTATYAATEGANSVSANRTIVVGDTVGPAITLEGANPYRIQQGSCSPFVDPGASAFDTCAGAKPVSVSISGPGGATSVNPAVAGTYTVTYTATDGTHSGTATRTVIVGTFDPDEVDQPSGSNLPPTITLNGDPQIHIECGTPFTDPGATAVVCGNPVQVTTTGTVDIHTPGVYSLTYTATANGQTVDETRIVTVEADNTAPSITLNGASPMTVECHTSFTDPGATAHDACAGDFPATASGSVDANTVGTYVITYNATDPSGHVAAPVTRTVNVVDTTPPTVTAPPNVTVNTGAGAASCSTTVNDATLGTATANDSCAGSLSVTRTGVPSGNVFPVGTTTVTYTATDGYNTTTETQTVTVIDNTAPLVTPPANVTEYLPLNSTATSMVVNYPNPATATDNCGGTINITYSPASGSTFSVGTTTVTVTATDAAGNVGTATFTVTVLYNFTGFFSPVDNLPTLNIVNAGRAVPVKFSLSGNKGLNIFAASSPYTVSINCDGSAPQNDVEGTTTAGSSSLTYDGGSDRYIYTWKTENSWANTCRQLVVKLNDGSEHRSNFKFK